MSTKQEYTDEEHAAEMQRVRDAIDSITKSQLDAFLKSGDAAKRRRHAASYRYKGYRTFRLSIRSPNLSNVPQGDPTEYEKTRDIVELHLTKTMRAIYGFPELDPQDNLGHGIIVGYTEQSRLAFQSFAVLLAVKQTIRERYEPTNQSHCRSDRLHA